MGFSNIQFMIREKLNRPLSFIFSYILCFVLYLFILLLIPQSQDIPPYLGLLFDAFGLFLEILIISLVFKKRHNLSLKNLITTKQRFNTKALFTGLLIWLFALILFSLLKFKVFKPDTPIKANFENFLSPLLFACLIFTPIQCFYEELYFRALLTKVMDDRFPNQSNKEIAIYSLASGLLFSAMHFNIYQSLSDMALIKAILNYFIFGAFLMYISLTLGGFEIAIGIHMANNLFLDLFLCDANNSLLKSPMFIYQEDPTYLLLIELIFCIVMTLIVLRIKNHGKEK